VRELFRDWQASRALSERTRENERQVFRRHLGGIADHRAQEVTPTQVAALMRELRERPYSQWRQVAVLRLVRGLFAHGIRRRLLTSSPADGLAPSELPKQRNERTLEVLDPAKVAVLIGGAETERWRAAIGLAGYGGLRLGELRALKWADVDFKAEVLNVQRSALPDGTLKEPKTAAGKRAIPLLPALRRLLVEWRLRSPKTRPGDLVVCTADGKPVQERNVRRALEAAKKAAGMQETEGRLSMHALRHAYCSALATEGLSPTTLARITGHTDPGFTLKAYSRDVRDEATLVADVLARAASAGFGV
jgi:integrase